MQQPQGGPPPPQFSPDGLYWWDGVRWAPRPGTPSAYAPPSRTGPAVSSGLRILLLIALGLEVPLTGVFTVVLLGSAIGGYQENPELAYTLGVASAFMFGLSVVAIVGVVLRTSWSRWVAIASGLLICWTVVGLVLGIPIVVAAARASDLPRIRS